uniref:Interleukin-7 n=1 Tax=Rousettus aegyptiacus TaxID=9407 RepID=A0A7J8C1Z4_ROUAE|nr:interleukin 7 [Rousettus aegyptiacus]
MVHVSFRYIFGIPPLILVLLPVASSDCEIEGRSGEEYEHVLRISLQALERRENESNCLDNEPNFFKKHSCDDNKEEKKSLKEQKKLDEMCFLKILLGKIQTCWNKILHGTKEH